MQITFEGDENTYDFVHVPHNDESYSYVYIGDIITRHPSDPTVSDSKTQSIYPPRTELNGNCPDADLVSSQIVSNPLNTHDIV